MINVKDIMVGDLLQNTNGNVGRVIGIRPYMGTAPSMKYDYEVIMQYHQTGTVFSDPKMLMPIPITPAILEKNGWLTKDGAIWFKKGPVRMGWYKKNCEFIAGYHTMPFIVEFVHQLQHVIKMLGMEDDFKV